MKRLLIILFFIPLFIQAQFSGGNGTSNDPYQIATAVQLDSVRNHLGNYYILNNDIDLSSYSDWTPIGYKYNTVDYFSGNLNGNGKTISNMHITSMHYDASHNSKLGLFLFNVNGIDSITLYHCSIIINDTGTGVLKFNSILIGLLAVGGACGGEQYVHIKDCTITATLLNGHYYGVSIAGMASYNNSFMTNYKKCSVVGLNVSVTSSSSYTSVSISCLMNSAGNNPGIAECYVDSTTVNTNSGIPNLNVYGIGNNRGMINCYAKATLNGFDNNKQSAGMESECYSTTNCYAVPKFLNTHSSAFSTDYYWVSATSCYFDSTVAGSSYDAAQGYFGHTGAHPKSTTDMKVQSTFAGWDFVNVWGIDPTVNDGYPYLRNNLPPTPPPPPPPPNIFNFKTPADYTHYTKGDTVNFSWHSTSFDSTNILTPSGNIKIFNDSTYNYVVPDTTLQFAFIAYSYGDISKKDSVTLIFKGGHKYLYIDTVKNVGNNLEIRTVSLGVDSLKYYYSEGGWNYFTKKHVDKTATPNVTILTYHLSLSTLSTQIKVEEDRDTARIITPVTYGDCGSMYSRYICQWKTDYGTATTGDCFEEGWVYDPGCGWTSGYKGYPAQTTLLFNSGDTYPHYKQILESENQVTTPCPAEYVRPNLLNIIGRGAVAKGYYTRPHIDYPYSSGVFDSYLPEAVNTITFNGNRYRLSAGKIYYDDLNNSVNNMIYCDLHNLYYGSQPKFTGTSVRLGIYLYPFETIYAQARKLHPNSFRAVYGMYGANDQGCFTWGQIISVPSISQAEIDSTVLPGGFKPMLIIQDMAAFNNTVAIPLLPVRDFSALLYDTWTGVRVPAVNYFRGIYPRAIKFIHLK